MQKITQLPNKESQDALKHLEQAWAYYSAEPTVTRDVTQVRPDQSEDPIVPYYTAA
ncbi:hypothetical protein [Parasedimentitalea denitrificans]|uniref:hypothetical protein n=1 Tax=Parasedimentitalea denitrificans TaxID=2211118 RepID=UPI00142FEC9C|nr:hypothetical protein [Sedimentitalea sp. CY04]